MERVIHLWQKLPETPASNELLKLIVDIQTTNQEYLYDLTMAYLKNNYSEDKHFADKIRLIGLRTKGKFQGAISHFELLTHMEKGNFVFHTSGWGVGEILDVSVVREQLSLEFDYVPGRKEMSFSTAFKTLVPIPKDHFLALRFGSPDLLEKQAKENSVETIRLLLRDLGPKTAAEIKDELCELVIPAPDWTRWWQGARAKIKKDTMISTPEDIREAFFLRKSEVTHEQRLQQVLENKPDANTLIQMVYSFMRDFPETLKNSEFKASLVDKLTQMLSYKEINKTQELQLQFFLLDLNGAKDSSVISEIIQSAPSIEELLGQIEVLSLKKRVLIEASKLRADWKEIFLTLIFKLDQAPLRDYVLTELMSAKVDEELKTKIQSLCIHPAQYPDAFLWYFQKIQTQAKIPFNNKEGKIRFFEGLLILLSSIENDAEERDLVKKIHAIITGGRFAIVRQIMELSNIEEVKEFLLLATKCHSFSDHDQKIFHSLAEVAHPSLAKVSKKHEKSAAEDIIWTTAEGYQKVQTRIQQIATVETVENAKEIEVARAHGDLRENAEFKAALERRDRLQSELKTLSDQMNKARVITKDDIMANEVSIGVIVDCSNAKGQSVTYTLLGPWDADPEKNILSFQSKLA
ncbi:MAG: GreA/GreB family elongation factor, partial [Chlamydiota bacterium]